MQSRWPRRASTCEDPIDDRDPPPCCSASSPSFAQAARSTALLLACSKITYGNKSPVNTESHSPFRLRSNQSYLQIMNADRSRPRKPLRSRRRGPYPRHCVPHCDVFGRHCQGPACIYSGYIHSWIECLGTWVQWIRIGAYIDLSILLPHRASGRGHCSAAAGC